MAESQSTRDMQGWLAKANANPFSSSWEYGDPSGDNEQENYNDESSVDGKGVSENPGTS